MRKIIITASALTLLTACGSQPPSAVVDGYAQKPSQYSSQNNRQTSPIITNINPYASPTIQAKQPVVDKPVTESYYVQSGDNLIQIAKHYDISVEAIRKENRMRKGQVIFPGQILKVPVINDVNESSQYSLTSNYAKAVESSTVYGGDLNGNQQAVTKSKITQFQSSNETKQEYTRHKVVAGENLYRIGLKYGISPLDLMADNNIAKPQNLVAGSTIKIPVKKQIKSSPTMEKLVQKRITRNLRKRGLVWPAKGTIIKSYGFKGAGVTNTGISIALPKGTEIIAADNGKVIYADNGLESYGNLILIRHNNGLVTAYAHNSKNIVRRNQKVRKGDIIALAGSTGNVERSQLHFEVRKNARAINPIKVLPRM